MLNALDYFHNCFFFFRALLFSLNNFIVYQQIDQYVCVYIYIYKQLQVLASWCLQDWRETYEALVTIARLDDHISGKDGTFFDSLSITFLQSMTYADIVECFLCKDTSKSSFMAGWRMVVAFRKMHIPAQYCLVRQQPGDCLNSFSWKPDACCATLCM